MLLYVINWLMKKGYNMSQNNERLTRSSDDNIIGGVCGGVAQYFDIDPTIIRIVFASTAVFTAIFPFLVLYIIAWIVIPEEDPYDKQLDIKNV